MKKQLIFIDDSGDPGFKAVSSDNFVVAAVVFANSETAESVMHVMDYFRKGLGWKYNHEFKFAKNPKNIIVELLHQVNKYDFCIYAAYIKKSDFRDTAPTIVSFLDKEKLYNWTIKELLRNIPFEETVKITIDGRSSKQNMKNTKTYLRREINIDKSKRMEIKFDDSVTTDLLQLADLIVGSINRSLQPDKTDSKDYISIFKDKIVTIQKINFR